MHGRLGRKAQSAKIGRPIVWDEVIISETNQRIKVAGTPVTCLTIPGWKIFASQPIDFNGRLFASIEFE